MRSSITIARGVYKAGRARYHAVMPVPTFTEDGLLPQGVHACTLDELERALGRGGQRASLMAKLRQYATLLREAWGAGLRMIVDGSFVTKEPSPNDVDVVVLIHEVLAGEAPLPLQATSINRAWVNTAVTHQVGA